MKRNTSGKLKKNSRKVGTWLSWKYLIACDKTDAGRSFPIPCGVAVSSLSTTWSSSWTDTASHQNWRFGQFHTLQFVSNHFCHILPWSRSKPPQCINAAKRSGFEVPGFFSSVTWKALAMQSLLLQTHPRFLFFSGESGLIEGVWRWTFSESERKHFEGKHHHGFLPADEGGLWRHLHTGGKNKQKQNIVNFLGRTKASWKNRGVGVPWRLRGDRLHHRLWDRLWVGRGGRGPLQGGWKLPGGRGEWQNCAKS